MFMQNGWQNYGSQIPGYLSSTLFCSNQSVAINLWNGYFENLQQNCNPELYWIKADRSLNSTSVNLVLFYNTGLFFS